MKLYRVTFYHTRLGNEGYEWFLDHSDARKAAAVYNNLGGDDHHATWETIDVPANDSWLKTVADMLNRYGSHPNNG